MTATESEHVLDVTAERTVDPIEQWLADLGRDPARLMASAISDFLEIRPLDRVVSFAAWSAYLERYNAVKRRMRAALDAWTDAQVADYERREHEAFRESLGEEGGDA